ncbi:aspartate/glutamate racemase family protein [Candidatus Pantoea edessiphila]|uniref:Asp/Glu racemase n=1 Tax=Candidatus Pantoea edessiphila TaxID=2044610 RepID=A0A2P5SVG3_9GAMM|nr:aspartate/glutamate racemase family protein [Candidatus Pantoea edessiphila]PPI86310.1 Asp/Glu racemase [Candidatus Pantoea edessiphila]
MHLIQVINPNTSIDITEIINQTANNLKSDYIDISVISPTKGGVPSIEGNFDVAIANIGVLDQVKIGELQGVQGHVIACFSDPGLLAAREIAVKPVIGMAEAAMHIATLLATKFSIITTLPRTLMITKQLLQQYGLIHHCSAIHNVDFSVLELVSKQEQAKEKIIECCIESKMKDGIGAIILGCAAMSNLAPLLMQELRIPVIDGISAAINIVELLIKSGLSTSKYGDLDFPSKKTLSGIFQYLN